MSVFLVGLALLGLAVAVLAVRELVRRNDLGAWPHKMYVVVVVVSGIATQSELVPAGSLLQLGIVVGCLVAVLLVLTGPEEWRSTPQPWRCAGVGLVCLLWLDLFVTNTVRNSTSDLTALAERLAPGVFWIATLLLWMAGGLRRDLFAIVLTLAVALTAMVTPLTPQPSRPCTESKCTVLGELMRGPFSSENYPAMLAAFAVVLVLSCEVGRVRWPAVLLCGGLLMATGGRSALIGAGVGLLVLLTVRLVFRGHHRRTGPAVVLALGLPMVCTAVGLSLIYLVSTEDLSRRGAIWLKARDSLSGQELFGLGISRWSGYGHHRAISSHFPHSVYLLTLFCGGLLAVTLFTAVVVGSILGSADDHRDLAAASAYAVTYMTIGLSEIVTNVLTVDGLTWAVLPLLAARSTPAPSPAGAAGRSRAVPSRTLPTPTTGGPAR